MKILFSLLIVLLSVAGSTARATICFPPDPKKIYDHSNIAVLAFPKAISTVPKDAPKRGYPFPFKQTILWQVQVSWKGPYKPGDTFTTRTSFTDVPGCSSPIYANKAALLLYVSGQEPYILRHAYYPELSIDQFKYLESSRHGP